jgi:ABC-type oligopeptide transport system substrate-binding subunit/DNA-binding SARP family transcriptional activator
MPRLSVYLLGPLRVTLDGEPVAGFESDKVRALLAYLAVEAKGPQRRERLAGLLWPDQPEQSARTNLRHVLANLRKAIGDRTRSGDRARSDDRGASPPFLHVSRQTIQLNRASDAWVDVSAFIHLVQTKQPANQQSIDQLEEAVELVRGSFLEGFSLSGCPAFEEWVLFEGERLQRLALEALGRLSDWYEMQGNIERALEYAWRQVELEPWREEAHQQVMRLLALGGQRGAALAQYETCRRILVEELGVEPAAETTRLYEQIRDGELGVSAAALTLSRERERAARIPRFLVEDVDEAQSPVFVAREQQLARLDGFLETALAGQGRVVFVTGGPGRGKTALLDEFARRAMETQPDLLVANGNCNAYSGVGDPYLPFRDVMGMLTGDVEAKWAAGAVSRDHALRLWGALPLAVQALVDHGPHMVPALVPAAALLSRAMAVAPPGAPWLQWLRERVERQRAESEGLEQSSLFQQVTNVLQNLAETHPLLLILDDLQWADTASIGLLFHLGRRLEGSRILIAGAYRPEEVALGRHGARTEERGRLSLEKILVEFKRRFGDVWVNLAEVPESEGRRFVDALLEIEPNHLGEGFRGALFEHAGGHPLFTVELLRAMQERGDLVQDEEGHWLEGPALDWLTLPPRVEGVIEARIGRLGGELREFLSVASVEGEEFTAQVVARVQEIGERQALRLLSRELEKRHRLVREQPALQVCDRRLTRYRFAHALFQQYLYNELSDGERALLHAEIAGSLEALYEGRTDEITVQLAGHYTEAGEREKAVAYLLQAGDQARGLTAYEEATDYYQRVLGLLEEQDNPEQAARLLMKLGLTYHTAFKFRQARDAYEEGAVQWQRASQMAARPAGELPPAPHALRLPHKDFATLDFTAHGDFHAAEIGGKLFSPLLESTPDFDVVPGVARNWEVRDGGRTYVFHLREDVRWSDGYPVTAADFEYTCKRMLDPAIGSPRAKRLYNIKAARAFHQGEVSDPDRVGLYCHDRWTLVAELEEPAPHFLYALGTYLHPVPKHLVEVHGASWAEPGSIVTNGPFRLESWKRGESLVLVRNREYHGRRAGNVERVEVCFPRDLSSSVDLYEADLIDAMPIEPLVDPEVDRVRQRHAHDYVTAPQHGTELLVFDLYRPPFDDPRLRQALVLATDRETLAEVVMRGYHAPATGGLVPPGMPGYSPGVALPYAPERARQLLAEAGYPQGRGFPAVDAMTTVGRRAQCEYLQAQWRQNLGIDISWHTMESRDYFAYLLAPSERLPHLSMYSLTPGFLDPAAFFPLATVKGDPMWGNEIYQGLLAQATQVMEQRGRIDLYRQADRLQIEQAAILPLMYNSSHWLIKPWVRGFNLKLGHVHWKDVIIKPH